MKTVNRNDRGRPWAQSASILEQIVRRIGSVAEIEQIVSSTTLVTDGGRLDDLIIGLEGVVHVICPGRMPIIMRGPFVIDRWILDSDGGCCGDVTTQSAVTICRVPFSVCAVVMGAIPELRRLSVEQRESIIGKRTILPSEAA